MPPPHAHEHHHAPVQETIRTAFVIGIVLNLLFVLIEAIAGAYIHSLALLSDAGHNLADVGALALSLLAYRLMAVKPTEEFTYGYRKTSVLVAMFNAIVLLISIGAIVYAAVRRLFEPEPVAGMTIALVAGAGIIINGLSALLFTHGKKRDMNVRSAYLHLMADAAISLGIVVCGVVIFFTHWEWLDPVVSFVIAGTIVASTWQLLRESFRSSMDAVPENISIEEIKRSALSVTGVRDMHHVHVWVLSATENALTAHVTLAPETTIEQEHKIKDSLKHLLEQNNIHHVTLETERENEECADEC